jgi:hypothetical protein
LRKVLFRGRTESGEWVEGDLLQIDGNCFIRVDEGFQSVSIKLVDPATVGQFTGLYDANKKRIFEGDIVTNDVVVALQKPCLVVFEYGFKLKRGNFYAPLPIAHAFATKTLGNIHDTPELMEVKQ